MSATARLCWALHARRWVLHLANVVAATFFVAGCVGFYVPSWYVPALTAFLLGSVLFLAAAVGTVLVEHGPSR